MRFLELHRSGRREQLDGEATKGGNVLMKARIFRVLVALSSLAVLASVLGAARKFH